MASLAARAPAASARWGGVLIALGVLQFSAAMGVVQAGYPGYSDLANYISDLGNTATSPWHVVFNVSILVLGLLAFVGVLLSWGGFPRGAGRASGLPLVLLASVGAVLVGLFPENVNPGVHDTASLLVFAPGGIALLLLATVMRPGTPWGWLRWPSALLGLLTLVSLAYYVPTQASNATWYPGLIERLIVFPILVWGLLVAAQLIRAPVSPGASVGRTA
jgi:hypothetical membrane protein